MPEQQLTLSEAVRRADELSARLNFPKKINQVKLPGPYILNDTSGLLATTPREISFSIVNPNGKLLRDIQAGGKKVVVQTPRKLEISPLAISIMREENENVAHISIDHRQTFCNIRFGLLKELLHIKFNIVSEKTSSSSVEATLMKAIWSRRSVGPAYVSGEAFCYAAAIEIMIPHGKFRNQLSYHRSILKETDYTLAQMSRVPLPVISFFFDGGYCEHSNFIHAQQG